ncbi:N-alpha-acetyltransferase 40 isoform X2 [Agelaius tricolor]|uniref:N-alpha-acetyltransferase 40 isoform X2 n=1 Tax=Agelaius tricolor TaxID=9191 RepID=UPI0039F19EAD
MGRKSSRAKEKKQRRLEERAAMAAVCAKVEAANKLRDPLEAFPVFKKYDRNGLDVSIECCRVSGLEPSTLDWAFELTKANMQSLYEQSEWGWKEREKRAELRDERSWFLLAREAPGARPVAFSSFRFDVECGDELRGAAREPRAAPGPGQVPAADPAARGQQHTDEEGDADGVQAQPRSPAVLQRRPAVRG